MVGSMPRTLAVLEADMGKLHVGAQLFVALEGSVKGGLACSWNGMVADDAIHSARQNALCEAIYEDLELV